MRARSISRRRKKEQAGRAGETRRRKKYEEEPLETLKRDKSPLEDIIKKDTDKKSPTSESARKKIFIHARTQLMNIYSELEKLEDEKDKDKQERLTAKGDRVITMREKKKQEVYKVYLITGSVFAVVAFILITFFTYAFTTKIPPKTEPQESQAPDPKLVKKRNVRVSRARRGRRRMKMSRVSHPFMKEILTLFRKRSSTPSHVALNYILKKIHFAPKDLMSSSIAANVYNLTGRLYFYKLHIDKKEELFSKEWKTIWKNEAEKCFSKAKELYQSKNTSHVFILSISSWMPERLWYNKSVIGYKNSRQAVKEMKKFLEYLDRFKF